MEKQCFYAILSIQKGELNREKSQCQIGRKRVVADYLKKIDNETETEKETNKICPRKKKQWSRRQ